MTSIWVVTHACFLVLFCLLVLVPTTVLGGGDVKEGGGGYFPVPAMARHGTVVKKNERWAVASSEFGEISAVKVSDGKDGFYHLQFITMEPNSLFLPVHLHSDMVFYVDSGNGTLSWTVLEEDGDDLRQVKLRAGDVYRLPTGSFFYIQSNLESDRHKLRIHAIFSDSKEELLEGSSSGAYSSVRDLVLGFDGKVLQAALNVKEEVIEELKRGERQAIVHGVAEMMRRNMLEVHYGIMRSFFGGRMNINGMLYVNKKKDEKEEKKKHKKEDKKKDDKEKPYNVLDAKRDVENCNGWSLVVTNQQLDALNNSNFGVFMVNLSRGAMMGPHWNPMTTEIAVVLRGRGMVHVVCPSATNEMECKNSRFKVEEGDVFVVPRYHPMAQMSFNDEELVFVGFTTTTKNNHPQFLVGRASVFQTLDKTVLAASLGVSNTTMDQVLSAQREAIILECVSCAEEEESLVEEEIEREKEEAKKREEEAARKKEEEEAKRQEAEKRKKEEEEEARRREEEAERARKKEEEEARKQEEEKRRREEEDEARRREEARREQEEERKREEAAARQREEEKRRQEEEAARRQEEEAAARQQEEEKRRQEEEAAARQWEEEKRRQEAEEEARRQEEEAAARQREEEEARRKQEQAAKQWQRQQEEQAKRKQEEAAKQWQRQQEEAAKRKQEEEAAKQWQQQQEEAAKRKQEEEAAKQWQQQEEEAAKRKQEEEAAKQRQQQQEEAAARRQHGGGGGGAAEWEGEAGRREEEEMARRQREAEATARGGGGGWQGNGRYEN